MTDSIMLTATRRRIKELARMYVRKPNQSLRTCVEVKYSLKACNSKLCFRKTDSMSCTKRACSRTMEAASVVIALRVAILLDEWLELDMQIKNLATNSYVFCLKQTTICKRLARLRDKPGLIEEEI
jgi:hypothetical protein